MITVTEKAAKKLWKIILKSNFSHQVTGVRFGVRAGGCSGFEYILEPIRVCDERHDDHIVHQHGIRVHIDPKSLPVVSGTEIDHSDNLLDGFIFKNPNAKMSCGCGVSFELKDKPKT